MKFKDQLPDFYKEVEKLMQKKELNHLLEQLPELEISSLCDCGDSFCSSFYVKPYRQLNIVEKNIIGPRYKNSIPLEPEEGMIIIDLDNFERTTFFEVIDRPDVTESLKSIHLT